jgi:hypothetical protein
MIPFVWRAFARYYLSYADRLTLSFRIDFSGTRQVYTFGPTCVFRFASHMSTNDRICVHCIQAGCCILFFLTTPLSELCLPAGLRRCHFFSVKVLYLLHFILRCGGAKLIFFVQEQFLTSRNHVLVIIKLL